MNLFSTLLAPLAMLFHGTAGDERDAQAGAADDAPLETRLALPAGGTGGDMLSFEPGGNAGWLVLAGSADAQAKNQVRIEQRMTIRIAPRPSAMRPSTLFFLPDDEVGPRFVERKMGKCLPIAGIAGVQAGGASKLILFMRDQRIVSASLERACRARDFYSGFYLARSEDGQLCVDRDTLLSRNGANCKLSRIRQLIEVDD